MSNGLQLEATVEHIELELDIALLKVAGSGFPHLMLAETSTVLQGESVIAVGNPGQAMNFSVTKGIVRAVGPHKDAGPGTWIQTDTPMNPGNSGGPLLNMRGEVVGISTQRLAKKGINGIGFALSAGDLLAVLRKFYGQNAFVAENLATATHQPETPPSERSANLSDVGTVVVSEPKNGTVYVDGSKVGQVPATLALPTGDHIVSVTCPGHVARTETITVQKGSIVMLGPVPWCHDKK